MLDEKEALEVYAQILSMVSQSGLAWIIPQVQEEISKGRIVALPLKTLGSRQAEIRFDEGGRDTFERLTRGNSKGVMTAQTYTANEQLLMLLNALEEVSDIDAIKNEAVANLKHFNSGITSVQITSEEGDTSIELAIDNTNTLAEDNEVRSFLRLKEIIQRIKNEINGNFDIPTK